MELKFASLIAGDWLMHNYPKAYALQQTPSQKRLIVSVPTCGSKILHELSATLKPPFFLLYTLIVPRGGSEAGRYQSPEMSSDELLNFIVRYGAFLDSDGRHTVWIYSVPDSATLVYDRHNIIYAYGQPGRFQSKLEQLGYVEIEDVRIPVPHQHGYSPDNDKVEHELLASFDWHRTDLQSEDEE